MKEKKSITRAGAFALADRIRKAVKMSRYSGYFTSTVYNSIHGFGWTVDATLRDGDKYASFYFYPFRTEKENEAEFGRMVQFLKTFDKPKNE